MNVYEINSEIHINYNSNDYLLVSAGGQINLKDIHSLVSIKEITSSYIKKNLIIDKSINENIIEGLRLFLQNIFTINDVINQTDI